MAGYAALTMALLLALISVALSIDFRFESLGAGPIADPDPISTKLLNSVHSDKYRQMLIDEWNEFKVKHQKKYEDEREEQSRYNIFIENRRKIARHNMLAHGKNSNGFNAVNGAVGKPSYTLAMNEFGDLLHHEFVSLMNGYRSSLRQFNGSSHLPSSNVVVPVSMDWREKGYVTPVKNQKHCGSCWAFSSTGALEGQKYRKTGVLTSLSEQNLIDCSKKYGNNGCNGGLMDNAFTYIQSNHGIDTEDSYPYEAKEGRCRYKSKNKGADDIGPVDIPSGDEEALLEAVATVGPVSIAIDASHESFQFYSTGVYDEPECSSEELDHGVLLVGYGVQAPHEDTSSTPRSYWIVKNSWGETWGEKGYIRMVRNKKNQCGVATAASYPRV